MPTALGREPTIGLLAKLRDMRLPMLPHVEVKPPVKEFRLRSNVCIAVQFVASGKLPVNRPNGAVKLVKVLIELREDGKGAGSVF